MKFNEIDVVVTLVPLSREGDTFPAGTIGTVVYTFSEPCEAYELEFIDDEGYTLGFVTALPDQIALVAAYKQ